MAIEHVSLDWACAGCVLATVGAACEGLRRKSGFRSVTNVSRAVQLPSYVGTTGLRLQLHTSRHKASANLQPLHAQYATAKSLATEAPSVKAQALTPATWHTAGAAWHLGLATRWCGQGDANALSTFQRRVSDLGRKRSGNFGLSASPNAAWQIGMKRLA